LGKVQIVQLDSKVRDRSLTEKLVDAVSAFGSSTIPALASTGSDVRFMLFKTAGVEFYGQSLTTQPSRVKSDPALCQAFVDGAMEAIRFVMTDPEEALDIFLKANDEVSMTSSGKDYARIGLGLTNLTNLVPELIQNGLGWADPAKVKAQTELVLQYAAGPDAKMPDLAQLFTNQFVGKVKLTGPALAAARKNAEPYRKYIG
jgi:ABC-type nitrate/sulfonate/bicarbonate transport system substrate-binding protein